MEEAKRILATVDGAVAAGLISTVNRAIAYEVRSYRRRINGNVAVDKAMRDLAAREEKEAHRLRAEYQETVQQEREKRKVAQELKDAAAKLAKVRKMTREREGVLEASDAVKAYSAEMLGHGKKKGGGAVFHKTRLEALNRIRAISKLSVDQENEWTHFTMTWHKTMAETHGEEWGKLFGEILQNLFEELDAGKTNALSDFMHRESVRVLGPIGMIRIPGAPR